MEIKYLKGDAVLGVLEEKGMLIHVVNDLGVMGAGIAKNIAIEWPTVEEKYAKLVQKTVPQNTHGKVLFCEAEEGITIANMFAQLGVGVSNNGIPLQYDWLEECLRKVFQYAKENNLTIHTPHIGSGLAGGNWDRIWKMITDIGESSGYTGTLVVYEFDDSIPPF